MLILTPVRLRWSSICKNCTLVFFISLILANLWAVSILNIATYLANWLLRAILRQLISCWRFATHQIWYRLRVTLIHLDWVGNARMRPWTLPVVVLTEILTDAYFIAVLWLHHVVIESMLDLNASFFNITVVQGRLNHILIRSTNQILSLWQVQIFLIILRRARFKSINWQFWLSILFVLWSLCVRLYIHSIILPSLSSWTCHRYFLWADFLTLTIS